MTSTLSPRLQTLARIAQAAGVVVMRHYEQGTQARVKAAAERGHIHPEQD